jgi:iron complex transport system ATP-binding protein
MLTFEDVRVVRQGRTLLEGVSFEAPPGQVTALVGPNGAGKSTCIQVAAGELRPAAGQVLLGPAALSSLDPRAQARRRAVLPQRGHLTFELTVAEVVGLGLAAWPEVPERSARVQDALHTVGLGGFGDRIHTRLSGGEQQRVHLARVLAQAAPMAAPVLLLDEPTSALDPLQQHRVLALARRQARQGAAVVVVLHDLGLADAYADRAVILAHGRVVAAGPTREALSLPVIREVYGLAAVRVPTPGGGGALVLTPPDVPLCSGGPR